MDVPTSRRKLYQRPLHAASLEAQVAYRKLYQRRLLVAPPPPRWTVKDVVGVAVAWLLIVVVVGGIVAATLRHITQPLEAGLPPTQLSLLNAFVSVMISYGSLPLAVQVVRQWRGLPWPDLGFRPTTRGWVVAGMLLGLSFVFVVDPILEQVRQIIEGILGVAPYKWVTDPDFDYRSGLYLLHELLNHGIFTPIVEECLFRGLLFGWLSRRYSLEFAVLGSSAVFALTHLANPGPPLFWLVPTFCFGVATCLLYHRSGSLWSSFAMHATINSTVFIIGYLNAWGIALPFLPGFGHR